jgi:integrase
MGTVNYWRARLFRNTYRDRQGNTVEVPEFYVRIHHAGVTRRVRLTYSSKDQAAEEALGLFHRVLEQGWGVVTNRQARLPASPTIDEFIEAYEKATASMDKAPRAITVRLYARSLRQLCAIAGVKHVRELTREVIEKARDGYRAQGRAKGRADSSIRNSLSTVIRNAASCFSREARAIMQRNGLTLDNPFTGIKCSSDIQPVSPLPHNIVERIWADASLLRDGDPSAPAIDLNRYVKAYKRVHDNREPGRWVPIDFRQPHPDAYAALLLAFGCGLRANEVDKARWSWLKSDSQGNCYIEIAKEADFRPKGETRRLIKIPRELHEALVATRIDMGSPHILGGPMSSESSEQGGGLYRRPNTFRTVNRWLRDRGVEAGNKYGKPLHRLRKQFGSEIATSFGLFAAQKLLGHASPTITSKHYAAQVDLPNLTHVRIAG